MSIKLIDPFKLEKMIAMRGETKVSFAKSAGISEQIVRLMCAGRANPSPQTAKRIVEKLGLEWHELFEFESRWKGGENDDNQRLTGNCECDADCAVSGNQ